jgi:hypothetical protein
MVQGKHRVWRKVQELQNLFFVGQKQPFNAKCLTEEPQRRKGERGNSESLSALLAGAYTTTFLVMETLNTALLLCPSKIFKQIYKKILSLFRNIQRYLIL